MQRRAFLAMLAAGGLTACSPSAANPTAPPVPAKSAPTSPPTKPVATAAPVKPTAAPARPTAAPPKPPRQNVRWRYGTFPPKFDGAPRQMGVEKGFTKDAGFDVEFVPLQGDNLLLRALLAGELESVEASTYGVLQAIETGSPIRAIGSLVTGMSFALYAKREIGSVEDLAGKSVGVSSPGSLPHTSMIKLLKDHGVDPNSINWVGGMSDPERYRGVLGGRIDAGYAAADNIENVEQDPSGPVKVLVNFATEQRDFLRGFLVVPEKLLQEQRADVMNAALAFLKGIRYAMDHRDETIDLAVKLTGDERDTMAWAYDWHMANYIFNPTFVVSGETVEKMSNLGVDLGLLKTKLPVDRIIDLSFGREVLAKAGEYKRS